MAVIINLKEVFSTDSQSELSNKINFNFNQLLALGVGQPGPIGPVGPQGAPGPIGPIGPQGPVGSLIFGAVPPTTASAPSPSTIPTSMVVNDVLITSDRILKKVDTAISATGWQLIADFNSLVQTALGSNISPYVKLTPTSRVIKPRVTTGTDLTNSAVSTDPSFPTAGLGPNFQTVLYNFNETLTKSVVLSGGVIQIADNSAVTKQFSVLSDVDVGADTISILSHGLNSGQYVTYSAEGGSPVGGLSNFTGYFVLVVDSNTIRLCETADDVTNGTYIDFTSTGTGSAFHKLITEPASPETIFPATSNLLVYSYFNNVATPAKQFDTNPLSRGYRYQLELGSIDTLETSYTDGVVGPKYVISPSFENLRVRKYRLEYNNQPGTEANPGTYFLRAEYDMSSDGITNAPESFSPRRNSEHVWKINKADNTSPDKTRTIEMKLTNSVILDDTETVSGILVDGIFLKLSATFDGLSVPRFFGMGFLPTSPNVFEMQISPGMVFSFNREVRVGNTRIKTNGIDYVGASATTWAITSVDGDVLISTQNPSATISLNQAVVVKEDRLAQGLPFPVNKVPSTDANTLDDYEEGTWTPILYGGALGETGGTSFDAIMNATSGRLSIYNQPAGAWYENGIYYESTGLYGGPDTNTVERDIPIIVDRARYVKIGKKVTCWVNFTINPKFNWITHAYAGNWPNPGVPPSIIAEVSTPGTVSNRFNFLYQTNVDWWASTAIGMTLPFPPENAPNSGSTGITIGPGSSGIDRIADTVLAGTFNLQIDDSLPESGIIIPGSGPDYPIVIDPAFSSNPFRLDNTGSPVSGSDGKINKSGVPIPVSPDPPSIAISPITPTSKCEIRIGYVLRSVQNLGGGSSNTYYHYRPAALFFAQRDYLGAYADSTYETRSAGTSSMSPVTALDCLYRATIPNATPGGIQVPDGVRTSKLIKFQAHFTYEAHT